MLLRLRRRIGQADGDWFAAACKSIIVRFEQGVEHRTVPRNHFATGIIMDLAGTSTGSIEGEVDVVAKAVGDVGEPMGGVMGVCDRRAVGIHHLNELSRRIVAIAGDGIADGFALQPAARAVGQCGNHAVGADKRQRTTVGVVVRRGNDLPLRIADGVQIAVGPACRGSGLTFKHFVAM